MTSHVAQRYDLAEPRTCARASHAQRAVRADVFSGWLVSCLSGHVKAAETNFLKRLEAFVFSRISISTLQFRLAASRSVGSVLLWRMLRVPFFPYAHLTRKCLNRVGVSNYFWNISPQPSVLR